MHVCIHTMSFSIECLYGLWDSRSLSSSVDGSSYVSFLRPFSPCVHLVIYFLVQEMSDLLWEDSKSLSHPSFHSLMMWLSSMFWFELIIILFIYSLSPLSPSLLLLIHFICFVFLSFSYSDLFQVWLFLCIILTHLIISSFLFIIFLPPLFSHWRSIAHEIFCTYRILCTRVWDSFFIIGYFEPSFLSFLSPYYPSLRFIPCLKIILRPWHHTFVW